MCATQSSTRGPANGHGFPGGSCICRAEDTLVVGRVEHAGLSLVCYQHGGQQTLRFRQAAAHLLPRALIVILSASEGSRFRQAAAHLLPLAAAGPAIDCRFSLPWVMSLLRTTGRRDHYSRRVGGIGSHAPEVVMLEPVPGRYQVSPPSSLTTKPFPGCMKPSP